MYINTFKYISAIFFSIFLFGCGGGGSSSNTKSTSEIISGYLIDSAISGVDYSCNSIKGTTDSLGKFSCEKNSTVNFSIGGIFLGSLVAKNDNETITPAKLYDLEQDNISDIRLINFIRLVQSLDSDLNASNGIEISNEIKKKLSTLNLDISDSNITEKDLDNLVTDELNLKLVTKDNALKHYISVLEKEFNFDMSNSDPAEIEINDNLNFNDWIDARNTSIITLRTNKTKSLKSTIKKNINTEDISNSVLRSTAQGSETFGVSKKITGLVIGQEYKLYYSFLTGTSMMSYGRVSEDSQGLDYSQSFIWQEKTNKEGIYTFKATKSTMYIVFLSTTDNAYIEVKYAYVEDERSNTSVDLDETNVDNNSWNEARKSSLLSFSGKNIRSTATGTNTFGITKKLSGLEVGQKYTLSYSFLTGTSKASYGRISGDSQGISNIYQFFEHESRDQKGIFTFKATQSTMYIAFLSITDNAYIEVEYADVYTEENTNDTNVGLEDKNLETNIYTNGWIRARDSSEISLNGNRIRSTADGTSTFGMTKEITNLQVGKKYTIRYSFLTGTSTGSFGRISEDSQGFSITYSFFEYENTDQKNSYTFIATQTTMYVAFLSITDDAYIEVEYLNLSLETEKTDSNEDIIERGSSPSTNTEWEEARSSSTISVVNNVIRSTAEGTATFGMTKEIRDLEIGQRYTLSYSFLTGTSTGSFGRISEDSQGISNIYQFFEHESIDQEGTYTFTATQSTMYIVFLSISDNAYIEVEYANLDISNDNVGSSNPNNGGEGTLLTGKLYTADELSRWRYNKDNKVYVDWSDLYYDSWAGYALIEANKRKLADKITSNDIVLRGTVGQKVDSYDNSTTFGMYDFGYFNYARDAVFVDLIEGTSTYTNTVKNLILEQAKEPTMQFSDRNYFPETNTYNIWLYAEWAHRVLKAYDYLPDDVFTAAERKIVDDWFKGAAEYFNIIANAEIDVMYTTRAEEPINSVVDYSKSFNNTPLKRYKNSGNFWAIGARLENKRFGMINLVTHVGVKYGIEKYKESGAQWVKEYLAFHIDDNGYFAELDRGYATREWFSLGYVSNTLTNVAEIAHILYYDGHENLFDYKSKTRVNPDTGRIETGIVEKSLEWMMLKLRENFMLDSSKKIYILDSTADSSKELIHFCKNTSQNGQKVIGRTYPSATIINGYYHNDKIEEMYVNGNMCGFPDRGLEINPGPAGVVPNHLFMYAEIEENSQHW